MKNINVADDIIPIGEFKTGLSKWFKKVQNTGHPIVITQNGKPAGVLLSPSEYDDLVYRKSFIESINKGLRDVESGRTYNTDQLKEELKKKRRQRPDE